MPVPAQIWGTDGSVLYSNPSFSQLFQQSSSDGTQPLFCPLLDEQLQRAGLRSKFERALEGAAAELQSVNYETVEHSQGEGRTQLRLFLALYPIRGAEGKVENVVCTVTDYSIAGGRFENELMRSQRMENVAVLASGVAHEFNNIFTGIRGLSDLIKDQVPDDSEAFEFAQLIQQSIVRGAELINKLNSFTREMPHVLRRTSLAEYMEQALPLLQLQVTKRVAIDLEVEADGQVMLDANRMDQALANIFSNSKEAVGGNGNILVRIARNCPGDGAATNSEGCWMLLEIGDSGPGIPDALRSRVIEPFFSTKERGKSTGLGLSMTHRIISLHGGEIEIGSSAQLGGAAIRIYLPVAEVQD